MQKIQALKTIDGICVAGVIYETNKFIKEFPYIDVKNKEYFMEVFDSKFQIGDKVRYIGHSWKISTKETYKITKIIPQVKNVLTDVIYIYYEIAELNNSKKWFVVNEKDITDAPSKWIVSFGGHKDSCSKPDVHELDYHAWINKSNSWKDWFIFDTQGEAIAVARLFKKYTAKDIINIIGKFENGVIEKLSKVEKFKEWLYEQDWTGSPEENHAHNCVINKFEELGLDEDF